MTFTITINGDYRQSGFMGMDGDETSRNRNKNDTDKSKRTVLCRQHPAEMKTFSSSVTENDLTVSEMDDPEANVVFGRKRVTCRV